MAADEPGCAPALVSPSYTAVATERDRARLRDWRPTLMAALAEARAADPAAVAAAGALLQPDAAVEGAMPPAGDYACSVTKLGSGGRGTLPYISYPAFRCSVTAYADGTAGFVKETGSQRPVGTLYPAAADHAVFLGTLQLGDERAVIPYGRDAERDQVARVERIGEARWRMVFPRPAFESLTDVIELTPL